MTGAEIIALLDEAADSVPYVRDGRLTVELLQDKPVMTGDTEVFTKRLRSWVGTLEFAEHPDDDFELSYAAGAVVTLFHEICGHGGQSLVEFDRHGALGRVLALNYYGCKASGSYYGMARDEDGDEYGTEQYFGQPFEIAAQYAGIRSGYAFLSRRWDPETANAAICEAHAARIKDESCFLRNGVRRTDVRAILDDLNREFRQQALAYRKYDPEAYPDDIVNQSGGASAISARLESLGDGLREDLLMSALFFRYLDVKKIEHPWKDVKSLLGLDLDLDHVMVSDVSPIKPMFLGVRLNLDRLTENVDVDSVGSVVVLAGVNSAMLREIGVELGDGSGRHLLQVAVVDSESAPADGKTHGYGSFRVHPDAVTDAGGGRKDIRLGLGTDAVDGYRIRMADGTYKRVQRTAGEVLALYEADRRAREAESRFGRSAAAGDGEPGGPRGPGE